MRNITLSDGSIRQVGPLKGKDVREVLSLPDDGKFTVVFETLARAGFPASVTDELPFPDIIALNKAVIAETYGSEEEEKN